MATTPTFAVTPRVFAGAVSAANTNRDGTGTVVTLAQVANSAMGTNGTKITSITCVSTSDPADSIVNVFLHDGTNAWFWDSFDLGNPAAASTTADVYRVSKTYADLVLPTGWTIRASITVAPTAGVVNVLAMGADF